MYIMAITKRVTSKFKKETGIMRSTDRATENVTSGPELGLRERKGLELPFLQTLFSTGGGGPYWYTAEGFISHAAVKSNTKGQIRFILQLSASC